MNNKKKLNWIEVCVSLVTLHYGLGFLIGSGEAIYIYGPFGILYALSTAFGLLALVFIAKFYWVRKDPIWTLMGKKYGNAISEIIVFLSCIWMIGVVASQVLGGAAVLETFGLSTDIAVIVMSCTITLLSLIKLQKLVKFFAIMLLASSLSLLFVAFVLGIPLVDESTSSIMRKTESLSVFNILGIALPTILVTFIGMDFHQFIIKARTSTDAVKGSVAGGIVLLGISFFILGLVQLAIKHNMLYGIEDPRQAIPLMLSNFGNDIHPFVSSLLLLPIIFIAIGSGSGVNRIVNISLTSSKILPKILTKKPNVIIMIFVLVILVALSGESIIALITSFYTIYVGSVFLPFLFYMFDTKYNQKFKKSSIKLAIIASSITMFCVFLLSYHPVININEQKTMYMLLIGFLTSFVILTVQNRQKLLEFPKMTFHHTK